ncbi:RagB/SusD family nutrient uptake outer membrane protein [Fodinibius salsisoli]|uniref:RagB/SusD family nutrient uptake outer membrane protein n=1 Tax=Fodinibius salsisoli TaxID=2820877 RepID=A0ABT3PPX2_9BACT|nr:RagB/SusD family nutrient uptake outer membrane protein [Fodinibius salsisoli]MCW9707913.1 RagB/SusD family nutrient uptake outer membrane protein [Fodinibius salsisoli]
MKKFIYFLLIVSVTVSCSDVLNLSPESEVTSVNFFKSESDFETYSNQFYDFFPREGRGFVDFIWTDDNDSDNQIARGNGNIFALGTNTVNDNPPGYHGGGWDFENIRTVNYYLDKLEASDLPESAKNRWEAEGRFFRAYLYFDKVQKYGDVPWFSEALSETDEAIYKPRDPRAFVIDKIIEDLNFAIDYLPQEVGNKENIDRFVAHAFKARAMLFEGTFRKYHDLSEPHEDLLGQAVASAEVIMNEGNYALHTDGGPDNSFYNYFTLPRPGVSSETILARHFSTDLGITHWSQRFILLQAMTGFSKSLADDFLCTDGLPISLSPMFDPATDYDHIEDEMANRDPRMHQSIWNKGDLRLADPDQYFNEDNGRVPPFNQNFPTGYAIKKFSNTSRDLQVPGAADDGIHLFRLGEIYLIYAEAKAELGTITQNDLDISINRLRDRVGMPHMVMGTLQRDPNSDFDGSIAEIPQVSVLIDEIRRERRVELAAEGQRREDLMRWKAGQLLAQKKLGAKFNPEVYPDAVGEPFARTNEDGFIEPYQGLSFSPQFDENKNYLYPIPPSEIGLYPDGQLTQNPGW